MKRNPMQLLLFSELILPVFLARGKEWIWAHDTTGRGCFFWRKAGTSDPYHNSYAGPPVDPRSTCGNGEYVDPNTMQPYPDGLYSKPGAK